MTFGLLLLVALALFASAAWPTFRVWHDTTFFVRLPGRAYRLQEQGRRPEAIALLEAAVRRRALTDESVKLPVRFALAKMYQAERRFAEAAEQARAAQACLKAKPNAALEAEITRCLADALDAQGKEDEARAVRSRVDALLQIPQGGQRTAAWHEARGKSLAQEGKHSEAAREFALCLEKMGEETPANVRAHVMIRTSLAFFNAGRFDDGLHYARLAIETDPRAATLVQAHRQAALNALSLNRLEDAEEHQQAALRAAQALGAKDQIAFCLAQTAHIRLMRGDIDGALATAAEASSVSDKHDNIVRAIRYEAQMLRGEYEESLRTLEDAPADASYAYRHHQRRRDAAVAMAMAQTCNALGRPDDSLRLLDEAAPELEKDERLRYSHAALRLEAQVLGKPDDPDLMGALLTIEERLMDLAAARDGDRSAQREPLAALARAAFHVRDYAVSRRLWELYRSGNPRPAYLPMYWYYVGECETQLGHPAEARSAYEHAVAAGIATYHARLAHERLASAGA
jgi:tetratricopeptide (TPR) repeat protein